MIREILLLIAFLILSQNVSAEGWFCTEESGQRQDNVMLACGIGEALNDEGLARKKALNSAIVEFETICDMSADCRGKKVIVEAKRTQCVVSKIGLTKCYRLIHVTILNE